MSVQCVFAMNSAYPQLLFGLGGLLTVGMPDSGTWGRQNTHLYSGQSRQHTAMTSQLWKRIPSLHQLVNLCELCSHSNSILAHEKYNSNKIYSNPQPIYSSLFLRLSKHCAHILNENSNSLKQQAPARGTERHRALLCRMEGTSKRTGPWLPDLFSPYILHHT